MRDQQEVVSIRGSAPTPASRWWEHGFGTIISAFLCLALPPVGLLMAVWIIAMNVRTRQHWALVAINVLFALLAVAWLYLFMFATVSFG